MLFSNEAIALYINKNFEPAWQSVRPVPMVHIDFGNGQVLTRTLHGNIATYLCNGDGQVLDILPGIYQPMTYLDKLSQLKMLSSYMKSAKSDDERATRLVSYHQTLATELAQQREPSRFIDQADISKMAIERGTKVLFVPGSSPLSRAPSVDTLTGKLPSTSSAEASIVSNAASAAGVKSPEELGNWKALVEDTHVNEMERRGMIHKMLAARKATSPDKVTKWLYKNVLHADLDDPYMGLGPTLFASYPFKD